MNIAIYIYDDAEVLDFSGPFEVFNTAKRLFNLDWTVFFLAEEEQFVRARGGMTLLPHFALGEHPDIDLLIVSGGIHDREQRNENVISWLKKECPNMERVASVCTGAFLLAQAGLLDDRRVVTHWEDCESLKVQFPQLTVVDDQRFVKDESYYSSAGISAGIDLSLALVEELAGQECATRTARQMDYRWIRE